MTVEELLRRLSGVVKSGAGWKALCPAHADTNPSLSIHVRDGKVLLLHCFAGCSLEVICAAAGIEMRELFLDSDSDKRIVATYDYVDERGSVLYQVVRYEPKSFRQRRPDGRGGWVWNLRRVQRVLYRLPEVMAVKSVLIVEGEKDVETARSLGFVGTTNPGGAHAKWLPEYSEALCGKRVAIIADADEAGRKHVQQVAASLHGKVESLKVLELPNAKDLAEWVEPGGTRGELDEIIRNAPEWRPPEMQTRKFSETKIQEAENLLSDPALLKRFLDDVAELGVVGEEENCTTIQLAMVSALGEHPINLTIKGESGSGKNFQCDMVASLHPPDRVKRLTRISSKALYYLPNNLSHKVLIFAEVGGGEDADYSIREIESSGELVMLVTEKKDGRFEANERRVKGPVAIINTTTRPHLNPENETRHFDITTDESNEQTARIFRAQARPYEDPAVEVRRATIRQRWRAAHALLKPFPVLIPFASRIGEKLPRAPVRMRRDYPRVLAFVAASALFHQRQREHQVIEGREHLVASLDDYKVARELAERMLRRAITGMTDRCETLLGWLSKQGDEGQFITAVARALGWTWRTAKKYLEEGEALGAVEKSGARYRAADQGKPMETVLPDAEALLTLPTKAEAAQRAEPSVNPSEKTGFSPSSANSAASAPQGRDGSGVS